MSKYPKGHFFTPEAKQSFIEREAKLRGNPNWPLVRWYNDEDFCELYRDALAVLAEQQKQIEHQSLLIKSLQWANAQYAKAEKEWQEQEKK